MKIKKVLAFFILLAAPSLPSQAYWVWSPESGKFVNPDEAKQDSAKDQYEYAMKLYRDKNLDKAADELKDLLKKYRTSKTAPEAEYRLGVIYEEKGDYEKAFDAYKTLVESYPQSERIGEVIEREYRIGNLFLSGRKGKLMGLEILPSLPRAAQIFEHIVKQAPYSEFGDQAQFHLALTYKKMGRYEDSMNAFQAVIDNYPKSDLVAEARFQVADSAYQKSNVEKRDEKALDKASEEVEGFLMRYPETTASEKASKLRQEIDEKNAEKNYRVATYYEKTKYLSSAIIYYKDVAKRYPDTKWGTKAREKLKALEQPVSYLSDQEEQLNSEIELKQAKLDTLDKKKDAVERDSLERELDRLKQRRKVLQKNKGESLKSREDDLNRRRGELKEKQKKLDKKKELLKTNKSEDFKKAIDKWQASLDEERDQLDRERQQLQDWKKELGMDHESFLSMLPFMGEQPTALEEVRRIDAKKLYKISGEKKDVLEEKELLYKQYQEVAEMLSQSQATRAELTEDKADFTGVLAHGKEQLAQKGEDLEAERARIRGLEEQLEKKSKEYKSKYGESLWQSLFVDMPKGVVTRSAGAVGAVGKSMDFLNPFSSSGETDEKKTPQELAELQMHLREKIAAQQDLTDTLSSSFDEELAMQEQKKLMESLDTAQETDARQMRKDIKQVEKEIRKAYEDIGDRHKKMEELSKQLDSVLHQREAAKGPLAKTGSAITAPFRVVAKGTHDFFMGRKTREVQLTEQAEAIPSDGELSAKAKELRDAIELEGLMIESRNKEIYNLRKQLDILKSRASLGGGYKFRSSIVTVPYGFMEDALQSARSLVPTKDRKEILINRLNEETRKLEEYRKELAEVDKRLQEAEGKAGATEEKPAEKEKSSREALDAADKAEEEVLRSEIQELKENLKKAREDYARHARLLDTEQSAIEREAGQKKETRKWDAQVKDLSGREGHLQKELKGLGGELKELIEKERKLEQKEKEILEKRINKIDQLVKNTGSKATAQDLLTERSRLEDRLSQIELRKDFLSKEMERF